MKKNNRTINLIIGAVKFATIMQNDLLAVFADQININPMLFLFFKICISYALQNIRYYLKSEKFDDKS